MHPVVDDCLSGLGRAQPDDIGRIRVFIRSGITPRRPVKRGFSGRAGGLAKGLNVVLGGETFIGMPGAQHLVRDCGMAVGGIGVVRRVDGMSLTVRLSGSAADVVVDVGSVRRVAPAKSDRLKIIEGDSEGETGELLGLDGTYGIVRLDSSQDVSIIEMARLVKITAAA